MICMYVKHIYNMTHVTHAQIYVNTHTQRNRSRNKEIYTGITIFLLYTLTRPRENGLQQL